MNIPSRVNPFGYDNTTPPGYVRAEFLESTGSQYISDPSVEINGYSSWRLKAKPTKKSNSAAFFFDATGNTTQRFGVLIYLDGRFRFDYGTLMVFISQTAKVNELYELELTRDLRCIINGVTVSTLKREDFSSNGKMYLFSNFTKLNPYIGQIYFCELMAANGKRDLIPVLDPSGEPCMYDTITGQPFRNSGTGQFIAGFNMDQAESLGSLIPANTTLTVSFPWEASLVQYNSRVEYSLEQAGNKGCTISVQYREPEKDSAIYNKYEECVTFDDVIAVNSDYKTDLTEDGAWEYPLTKLEKLATAPWFMQGSPLKSIDIELPAMTNCGNMFRDATKLETARISLPVITTGTFRGLFENCSALKSFYVSIPNAKNCVAFMVGTKIEEVTPDDLYAPQVTAFDFFASNSALKRVSFDFSNATILQYAFQNCSNFESFASDLPELSDGAMAFALCKLNKESALRILNSIPTWTSGTHKLTIGIHIDYQNDEEVLTAIANAEAKGWTVTVQWNGTATAQTVSTFGLRKPPIYAKLGTVEHPDGTIENFLDWGHYVTNAEENGYQEFASKEEAYEHFNLEIPTEE